ncbi:MAG TPA: hypothetical protein VKB54_17485 [Solirubrobacteraceae bacterium]|nr:hypothetical protein [Solirubrobacteraceae bacterium]
MHRAVYAVGHANPPLEGRFLAAVKACGPGAALSHFSAAALWGFVDWDARRFEVTVPGTRSAPTAVCASTALAYSTTSTSLATTGSR